MDVSGRGDIAFEGTVSAIRSIRHLAEQLARATTQLREGLSTSGGQAPDAADQVAQTLACVKVTAALAEQTDADKSRVGQCPQLQMLLAQTPHVATGAVDDIIARLDVPAVRLEFLEERQADPVLHFYEQFLTVYAPQQRLQRGVFYTPQPLAKFVVSEVDRLLIEECGIADGLAGNVRVIDPAVGTGTFLVEVLDLIRDRPSPIGPQLIGCELLPAACSIAQMRLTLKSLESPASSANWQLHWMNSLEASIEHIVFNKDEPTPAATVILGNPPYRIGAEGRSDWIDQLCAPLRAAVAGERNIQPLCDAYVQFLMLSAHCVQRSPVAVVGLVTNRSWLDGLVHRGLRQEFLKTFDSLTIIDLGGDTRQRPPGGSAGRQRDQNVFDVTQGVAVTLAVRSSQVREQVSTVGDQDMPRLRGVRLLGSRAEKLAAIGEPQRYLPIHAVAPDLRLVASLFSKQPTPAVGCSLDVEVVQREYLQFPALCDLMPFRSPGVKTSRDAVFYAFTLAELEQQVRSAGFEWEAGRAVRSLYRAGDIRWLYYDPARLGRARTELAQHVLDGESLSLMTTRQFIGQQFSHVGLCRGLACHGTFYLGNRGQDYQFPLWLRDQAGRRPNLHVELLPPALQSPEQFLNYALAVLHSEIYRERFLPSLQHDFPRIPLMGDPQLVTELCEVGQSLVDAALILFESDELAANHTLEDLRARFTPEIWSFEQGGYVVAERWLKARRRRQGTLDGAALHRLLRSIEATLVQLPRIDAILLSAFPTWISSVPRRSPS